MKTLPLVDSNMVSYSFIAALPLSLEEIIYLKTQRPLWNLPGSVLCVLGNGFYTENSCSGSMLPAPCARCRSGCFLTPQQIVRADAEQVG